ncbi:MAG: hypothetical protein V9E83_03135 [Baekduia sp.]
MSGQGHGHARTLGVLATIAAGLVVIALAHSGSRAGEPDGWLFWAGLGAILIPAGATLAGHGASRQERITIVIGAGLGMYLIKVLRDPFAFTFGDELAHLRNVQAIDATGALFGTNTILPVTPRYPGLESVTAFLASAGGISHFAAGLIVVGIARLVFVLAVYLLYERLTGSPRIAGVGALLSMAAPTFLYFSAQFSYESLAIPLATAVIFALVRRQSAVDTAEQRRWSALVVVLSAAVILTHHLTSYAVLFFLIAACVAITVRDGRRHAPWAATAIVAAMTAGWLAFVASDTVGYLSPVLGRAFSSVGETLSREAGPRKLFDSAGSVDPTPLAERLAALFAVVVLAIAIINGVRTIRRQRWASPILLLLLAGALSYLATQPLRLVPAAWETGNRAGSVLFIAVGVTAAAGLLALLDRRGPSTLGQLAVAAAVAVIVGGGVIAGWPANLRLAQPYRATAEEATLEPPGAELARWARTELHPPVGIGAQNADARLLVTIGGQPARQGTNPNVEGMLDAVRLEPWHRRLLKQNGLALVASNRLRLSRDNMDGYFFPRAGAEVAPPAATAKFDLLVTDRLYDDGDIVVFDVRGLW